MSWRDAVYDRDNDQWVAPVVPLAPPDGTHRGKLFQDWKGSGVNHASGPLCPATDCTHRGSRFCANCQRWWCAHHTRHQCDHVALPHA